MSAGATIARVDVDGAYRTCRRITRAQAANFYYGIRLLPPDKYRALCAVYALARRIDDVGDGDLPAERKLALLEGIRRDLEAIGATSSDPVLVAVDDAANRFPLPLPAFADLVDGVEMDVRGTSYEGFEDLVGYCRRVAGSIGRLSVAIFGAADMARAAELADDLGVAMQLVNILRDVREDRAAGRVYLPMEDLRIFGVDPSLGLEGGTALVRFEAGRSRTWFERGLELVPMLDRRSAACVRAMTGIYRRLLVRMEREPEQVLRRRLSLSPVEKAWIAARSLVGVGG